MVYPPEAEREGKANEDAVMGSENVTADPSAIVFRVSIKTLV